MKTLLSSTAAIVAISLSPAIAAANSGYDAHERCKSNEDTRQVLGGLAGAVVGGVVGSQVSGNGARTEGSAIGAVLGGLAGVGIADKTVDCDPVYETTETVYASQPTTQYGHSQYGTSQPAPVQYGTTQYGGTQPYYEDRVTVSNHPVYSDPTYGAGGVSQGTTYSTGTVTYPPSGNNSQYAYQTYGARDYTTASTTGGYYSQSQPSTQRVVYSQPVSQRTVYTQPTTHRTVYTQPARVTHAPPRRHVSARRTHYHGRYSCDMGH